MWFDITPHGLELIRNAGYMFQVIERNIEVQESETYITSKWTYGSLRKITALLWRRVNVGTAALEVQANSLWLS